MRVLQVAVLVGGAILLGCTGATTDSAEPAKGFLGIGGKDSGTENEDPDPDPDPDPDTTDSDEDGLTDSEEEDAGTNPDKADSDGDGFDDPDELKANTDPNDDGDKPYQGGWPIGACRKDIDGQGYSEGDVSTNFMMPDQFGEEVELHAFCENVVYMVFAAVW